MAGLADQLSGRWDHWDFKDFEEDGDAAAPAGAGKSDGVETETLPPTPAPAPPPPSPAAVVPVPAVGDGGPALVSSADVGLAGQLDGAWPGWDDGRIPVAVGDRPPAPPSSDGIPAPSPAVVGDGDAVGRSLVPLPSDAVGRDDTPDAGGDDSGRGVRMPAWMPAAVGVVVVLAAVAVAAGLFMHASASKAVGEAMAGCRASASRMERASKAYRAAVDASAAAAGVDRGGLADPGLLDVLSAARRVGAVKPVSCADGADAASLRAAAASNDGSADAMSRASERVESAAAAVERSAAAKLLGDTHTKALKLLKDTHGRVKDNRTRETLRKETDKAAGLLRDAKATAQALTAERKALEKAMKTVNDSVAAKRKADQEAAKRRAAEARRRAAQEAARASAGTSSQARSGSSGSGSSGWSSGSYGLGSRGYGGSESSGSSGSGSGSSGSSASRAPSSGSHSSGSHSSGSGSSGSGGSWSVPSPSDPNSIPDRDPGL